MARYPQNRKVVWSEGMFLLPQHFQQSDRYHESLLNLRLKSIAPLSWGLVDLEINEERLENGNFMLLSCHGILPGGSPIDIPETDPVPMSRAIEEHFDPSLERLDVYLALPVERPDAANCSLGDNGSNETRYSTEFISVVDENTGDNEQQITTAKKNFKLLFTGELLDDHDYLKIAELERTPSGAIALKEDYIPPCIAISASHRLMRILRRLRELLSAKSDELSEQCQQRTTALHEISPADVYHLWSLQTINQFIPELNHFYRMGQGHPEEIFRLLSLFAGALTAFSADIRPMNLPEYHHDALSRSFGELDTILQELLSMLGVAPSKPPYTLIPLEKTRESIYEAAIDSSLFDPTYKFYLAVKGEGDQRNLIEELPRQAKIASISDIELLIGRAMRGVGLHYAASPPTAIPRKSGVCSFALDTQSDFWEDVQQSKSLAIYIPTSFGEIELELIALEEE